LRAYYAIGPGIGSNNAATPTDMNRPQKQSKIYQNADNSKTHFCFIVPSPRYPPIGRVELDIVLNLCLSLSAYTHPLQGIREIARGALSIYN
jgi:hypothetical protein